MTNTFNNISDAAISVLTTENARQKADQARVVAVKWKNGELPFQFDQTPPDRPARPKHPVLLEPSEMPKRGKAGNDSNRRTLLHAIAHIELNAIDLAFDMVARFGGVMPRAFTDDWIKVGDDEARHYTMLAGRLKSLDCYYGEMPAHDGLWQSALDTKNSLPARLAIVPMVLEARGLDVTPKMIEQFKNVGDEDSVRTLQTIYDDEIHHVAAGTRWFKYLAKQGDLNPDEWFKELVQTYFKGSLRPPFNGKARSKAGMPPSFYEPLVDMLKNT